MAPTPPSQPAGRSRDRRLIVLVIVVLLVVAVVVALVAGWFFFFGTEAPPAPTLDDALQVLLPSASPE